MALRIKRIYDAPSDGDGQRILVDRLWPRGISKDAAQLHSWVRELAPSDELRKWYAHEPEKWPEFRRRYFAELDAQPEAVERLLDSLEQPVVTLLFSSKELELNNAAALREYLQKKRSADG